MAAECDYVLAEGISTTGDKFELVANENVTSENKIILYTVSKDNYSRKLIYKILNTDDMAVIKEFEEGYFYDVKPLSEGLFYAVVWNKDLDGDGYNDKLAGFYNEQGELEIDLSKYNVTEGSVFSNDKTTFEAENNTGKKFEIAIDKSGKVISEIAVN